MKRIGLLLFILFMGSWALAQPPVGFSYQAVVRDGDGRALENQSVQLRIKLTSSMGSPVHYTEVHSVTTNDHGLVNLVVGQGSNPEGALAEVPWATEEVILNVEMRQGSSGAFQPMGSQPLQAVPYSLYATESGKVSEVLSDPDADDEEPIFVVRNKEGKVVFAVYQSGVRVYVDDTGTKRPKGGFAVGGYSNVHYGKDEEVNFLMVTPDSTRVSFRENEDGGKRPKGGFAVGGYSGAHSYLNVTPSHTQISFADDGTKRPKGGFAVGGYSSSWGKEPQANYFTVTPDSTRVSFKEDDDGGKRPKGGFAVGGYSGSHSYLNVTPSHTQVSFDTDNTGKRPKGGFAVGGYSSSFGKSIDQNYFDITMDATGVINPAENRVLWYPQKNAFMAGRILVESPDEVGENSFAVGYESKSKGEYSQAMGFKAQALGNYSTAIGRDAVANQTNSFAFGQDAKAQGQESYAIGRGAIALGEKSFAIGSVGVDSLSQATGNTQATGAYSVAMGLGAQSLGEGSFAIGLGTEAEGNYSMALGYKTLASEYYATAMGQSTVASGNSSTAMGYMTEASGEYSVATGWESEASGNSSTAMGSRSEATYSRATAIGSGTKATAQSAVALGQSSIASGHISTALGSGSISSGHMSTAIGSGATASGQHTIALGPGAEASGQGTLALGWDAKAIKRFSVALGYNAESNGDWSTAIGYQSKTSGNYSIAMGYKANASGTNSFAINLSTDEGLEADNRTFQISGANYIRGNVAYTNYSDRRLKKDIQYLGTEDNLKKILQLKPVRYRWKDNDELLNLGLIAQEVEEIVPESVRYDELNDIYSMEYTALIPVLIEGMKEQQQLIEQLKAEIEELKQKVQ